MSQVTPLEPHPSDDGCGSNGVRSDRPDSLMIRETGRRHRPIFARITGCLEALDNSTARSDAVRSPESPDSCRLNGDQRGSPTANLQGLYDVQRKCLRSLHWSRTQRRSDRSVSDAQRARLWRRGGPRRHAGSGSAVRGTRARARRDACKLPANERAEAAARHRLEALSLWNARGRLGPSPGRHPHRS
jgi:hypothetical protein